jgi:hypothetical protein
MIITLIVIVACAAIVAVVLLAARWLIGRPETGRHAACDATDDDTASWMHDLVGPAMVAACRPLIAVRIRLAVLRAAIDSAPLIGPVVGDVVLDAPVMPHETALTAPVSVARGPVSGDMIARERAAERERFPRHYISGAGVTGQEFAEEFEAIKVAVISHQVPGRSEMEAAFSNTGRYLVLPTSATWTARPLDTGRDLPARTSPGSGPGFVHPPPLDDLREQRAVDDTAPWMHPIVQAQLCGQTVDDVIADLFGPLERVSW